VPVLDEPPQYLTEHAVSITKIPGASAEAIQLPPRQIKMTVSHAIAVTQWFRSVESQLQDLFGLGYGWDTYRARQIQPQAAEAALSFLLKHATQSTKPPWVVPLGDGGIQLEWHGNGIDLEVAFPISAEPELVLTDLGTGEEVEAHPFSVDTQMLAQHMGKLRLPV
jgi:hypothetical protein